jgi:hypothetical protein
VDNASIAAKTMIGPNYWVVPALPHDQLQEILRKHGVLGHKWTHATLKPPSCRPSGDQTG